MEIFNNHKQIPISPYYQYLRVVSSTRLIYEMSEEKITYETSITFDITKFT